MGDLFFIAGAVVFAAVAVAVSPLVRTICWDAFVHPRYLCVWEKTGRQFRELKAGIDDPAEK